MAYTEEELAGLTDEERAMLEDDDEDTADGRDDEGEAAEGADESGADDAEGGDAATDAGADDGEQESEQEEPEAPAAPAPILVAEAPEKAEERLGEIKAAKADLRKKYDEGELTFDEYESQVDVLDDERMEIRLALKEAETAAKIEHQRQVNEKEAQINGFLSEYSIKRDYSDLRFAALDTAVRVVASQAENSDLGVREILQKAMDLCVEQGVIQPKQAKPVAQPAKAKQPKPTVPTLASVPAADMTSADDGNRFAHLDRLDPVAREAAFARLSPADQEAYLSA